MIVALALGTLLALAGLAFVLYPLFADPGAALPATDTTRWKEPEVAREDPVAALREVEFDRATGKLSDTDYAALRARYTERALAELRARDSRAAVAAVAAASADVLPELVAAGAPGEPGDVLDVAEAAVRRQRARLTGCATCGPRPEPDALYCSDCGRYLPGRCAGCGTTVDEPGARFCPGCGTTLAA